LGVLQGLARAAGGEIGEGDAQAADRGIVEIAPRFLEPDRLPVVVKGAVEVAASLVDVAELVVGHRKIGHRIRWQQLERLVIAAGGLLQVGKSRRVRPARGFGFVEALEGDEAEQAETSAPSQAVVLRVEVEAPPEPALRPVALPRFEAHTAAAVLSPIRSVSARASSNAGTQLSRASFRRRTPRFTSALASDRIRWRSRGSSSASGARARAAAACSRFHPAVISCSRSASAHRCSSKANSIR